MCCGWDAGGDGAEGAEKEAESFHTSPPPVTDLLFCHYSQNYLNVFHKLCVKREFSFFVFISTLLFHSFSSFSFSFEIFGYTTANFLYENFPFHYYFAHICKLYTSWNSNKTLISPPKLVTQIWFVSDSFLNYYALNTANITNKVMSKVTIKTEGKTLKQPHMMSGRRKIPDSF